MMAIALTASGEARRRRRQAERLARIMLTDLRDKLLQVEEHELALAPISEMDRQPPLDLKER